MLRHLGAILLAASVLHVWGVVLQVGPIIADPFSSISPLEKLSGLSILVLTRGGFQMLVGWYLWRHGQRAASEGVPYGALLIVRRIGAGFLVATTVVEVIAALSVITQQWLVLEAMSVISLPLLSFGFLLFWLGTRLPPPASKEKKASPRGRTPTTRRAR
jgi:hypothetical protein